MSLTRGVFRSAFALVLLTVLTLAACGCSLAAYGLGVGTMVSDLNARQREDYAEYRAQTESAGETPLSFRVRGQER